MIHELPQASCPLCAGHSAGLGPPTLLLLPNSLSSVSPSLQSPCPQIQGHCCCVAAAVVRLHSTALVGGLVTSENLHVCKAPSHQPPVAPNFSVCVRARVRARAHRRECVFIYSRLIKSLLDLFTPFMYQTQKVGGFETFLNVSVRNALLTLCEAQLLVRARAGDHEALSLVETWSCHLGPKLAHIPACGTAAQVTASYG